MTTRQAVLQSNDKTLKQTSIKKTKQNRNKTKQASKQASKQTNKTIYTKMSQKSQVKGVHPHNAQILFDLRNGHNSLKRVERS